MFVLLTIIFMMLINKWKAIQYRALLHWNSSLLFCCYLELCISYLIIYIVGIIFISDRDKFCFVALVWGHTCFVMYCEKGPLWYWDHWSSTVALWLLSLPFSAYISVIYFCMHINLMHMWLFLGDKCKKWFIKPRNEFPAVHYGSFSETFLCLLYVSVKHF